MLACEILVWIFLVTCFVVGSDCDCVSGFACVVLYYAGVFLVVSWSVGFGWGGLRVGLWFGWCVGCLAGAFVVGCYNIGFPWFCGLGCGRLFGFRWFSVFLGVFGFGYCAALVWIAVWIFVSFGFALLREFAVGLV